MHTILGTIFGVLVFLSAFTVGLGVFVGWSNYNGLVQTVNQATLDRASESLQIVNITVIQPNFAIFVSNTGGIGIRIATVYIQQTTNNFGSTCQGNQVCTPSFTGGIVSMGAVNQKLTITQHLNNGESYLIVLVTTRGRVFATGFNA